MLKLRQGFTMVELLVVIAMLMLLVGAVTSSVASANRRVKIQQATAEAQEMTNAILAYENFGKVNDSSPLAAHLMEDQPAEEDRMAFILGLDGKTPVLFNAAVRNKQIRDPWGHAYRVTIAKSDKIQNNKAQFALKAAVSFPNFNRRPADKAVAQ